MTLCIAAKSFDEEGLAGVVCCFDARVETETYGSDTEIKLRHLPNGWGALYSGKQARADELLGLFRGVLSQDIDASNTLETLRQPLMTYKRNLIQEYLNSSYGIGYNEFYSQDHGHLSEEEVRRTIADIKALHTNCQLILFRIIQKAGDIYTVDYNFSLAQSSNFAAIGTGADTACSWLHFRKQNVNTVVDQSLYNVYEAKKFATLAHAPGVGDETHLVFLCSHGQMHIINRVGIGTIEKLYDNYGPKQLPVWELPESSFQHFDWKKATQQKLGSFLDKTPVDENLRPSHHSNGKKPSTHKKQKRVMEITSE